ncbi:MAG TPA: hypothetical protein VIC58_03485 [Actinomycetota bacterium]
MRWLLLARARRDEGGFVLVVVLLALVFVMTLITGVMAYSVGSQNLSRRDQDWNGALSAAEAGIDDYVFHLNQDGSYWQYSDSNPPPDGNEAFSTWVSVPGTTTDASYRYEVDTSFLPVDGTLRVTSTGRVGNVTRTIDASVRRRNFLDFLYFTDLETKDPALYTTSTDDYTAAEAQTYCAKRYYEGRDIAGRVDFVGDTDGDTCTEINFASVDVINGPLHTNDAIRINGNPTFLGDTSDSWDDPADQRWWGPGPSPSFLPGDPRYADPLTMPPNNVEIKNETNPSLGGTGCLFTGPTAIKLNSSGTFDVISPFTKVINCSVTQTPTTSLYGRFTMTRFSMPPNGVVYVQNVPSAPTDPNYTNGCPSPFNNREAIGGTGSGNPNRAHPLGFRQNNDSMPQSWYQCRNGDVFLQGTLTGRLTIAADNNIVLFGSVSYTSGLGGADLLGLVANNYIEVYHPTRNDGSTTGCDGGYSGSGSDEGCSLRLPGTNSSSTSPSLFSGASPGTSTMATATGTRTLRNPTFHAALVTVQHSFRVQTYQYGDETVTGTINLFGAIAQKYRGIVGLINTSGYAKNYNYDQRLKYDSPPKFLNPVASAWQIVTWAESGAAHDPTDP